MEITPKEETVTEKCLVVERDPRVISYPQLSAANYTSWVIRVEALMQAQGIWDVIEPTAGVTVDDKKDKMTRANLLQVLPEDLLMQVAKKKTAKEVWECLKTRFVGEERVKNARLQTLKSEFDAMRMKEDETLDQYAGKLNSMSVRYANLGATLDDAALVKKLFDTVPERYLYVIAGIEQFCDLDSMPFEEAVGRLKTYEERARPRANSTNGSSDSQLLLTHAEWLSKQKSNGGNSSSGNKGKQVTSVEGDKRGRGGRGRGKSYGKGGRGQGRKDDVSGSGNYTRDKSHIKCFNCSKMGHYASECKAPKKEEEAHLTRAEDTEQALLLGVSSEEDSELPGAVLLNERKDMSNSRGIEEGPPQTNVWYLDNGASNHMTGDVKKFCELNKDVTGRVKFGDGSSVQITGKGAVLFSCKNGDQWLLREVYYIPSL